jgi:hypothetical protein
MSDASNGSVLKVVIIVLAVIGAFALLAAIGMAVMHFGMMGRIGC